MIKKAFLSILILLFSSNLSAEIVKEILIEGNSRVSEETIKVYGDIQINKEISESEINNILENLYSTEFFEDVKIELNKNILKINLKEYPVINQLIITGEKKKGNVEEIKKLINLKEKKSFIRAYLSKDIETIKKLYSSLGYNFSKVEAKVKELDNNKLDLLIQIERGVQTKISSINFIGNNNIRSKRLKDVIASEEDKFWKIITRNTNLSENLISLDKRLLINYYKSNGYYDVKISSNIAEVGSKGGASLVYTIDEGNRYIVNKISTKVDSVFDKKLFFPLNKSFKKYVGDYYSPFKVKRLLEELDELIDINNLQFVEHNVQEEIVGETITIIINIFEGKKEIVERINIKGNITTNEDVIRGELLIDEGDPLTNINLEKSIAKIKARKLFKTVNYEVLDGSSSDSKIINIEVEEQPTGEISAGAGIGTSGGTIALSVKENNWLGEGKNVNFELELSDDSIAGDLTFVNPNYDYLGNSFYYSLSSEKNDKPDQGYENSIVGASLGTSFEQYRDFDLSLGLSVDLDDLKTDSSASSSLKKQAGTFSEFSANYGFTYDQRNRAFMPTSGSIVTFRQSLPLYADKKFVENTFSASSYKTITEDIIGAGKIYLSAVNGLGDDDVRLSKRKGLSDRRLRGFERYKVGPVDGNDHIGGNYAAAVNFETNLPNVFPENSNTDVGLFLDIGNVWGVDYDDTLNESNKLRSSTGVTLNYISPIGPLSFVFSQNLSKADTDKTESFSFNLGTTF